MTADDEGQVYYPALLPAGQYSKGEVPFITQTLSSILTTAGEGNYLGLPCIRILQLESPPRGV